MGATLYESRTARFAKSIETRSKEFLEDLSAPRLKVQSAGVAPSPLPAPWQESRYNERVYYYNPETKVSTWDRPQAEAAKLRPEARESREPLPAPWQEFIHPQNKRPFYYNT